MRRRSAFAAVAVFAVSILFVAPLGAEHASCQPPREVAARVEALDVQSAFCRFGDACWTADEAELRALVERYPADVAIGRTLQTYELSRVRQDAAAKAALVERYDALVASRPEDPGALYLRARLSPSSSKELLEKALRLEPGFPWAHLGLASIELSAGRKAEGWSHLQEFMAACPSRVDLWTGFLPRIDDPATSRELLQKVRAALAERPWPRTWHLMVEVWGAEARLAGTEAGQLAMLRERVGADLIGIENLNLTTSARWWYVLQEGYSFSGGDLDALARRREAAMPCDPQVVSEAVQRLPKAQPGEEDLGLDAARAVVERCPDDFFARFDLFERLLLAPAAADDELRTQADGVLAAWRREKARGSRTSTPPELMIAEGLLGRQLDPEKALVLLNEAGAITEAERELALERLDGERLQNATNVLAEVSARIHLATAEAGLLLARQESGAAVAMLASLSSTPRREALLARSATLGRQLDASTATAPTSEDATPTLAPAVSRWAVSEKPWADLSHLDIHGKRWTVETLRGKTWLVNVWATWCGPCLAELPEIQKLAKQLAGREDIGVLTLNVDRHIAKVGPFLQRFGYDFPVLLGGDQPEIAKQGIPQNWLVDRDGVIRRTTTGFPSAEREVWLADALRELEHLAKAAPEGP